MLSREAISPNVAPADGNISSNVSEVEAMLPTGTVDHTILIMGSALVCTFYFFLLLLEHLTYSLSSYRKTIMDLA
ncbi:hypothetical protein SLA2020_150220 [Shorea laevis]